MAARIVKINRKTLYDIIKEIRNRPCLWDTDDEYYNNRGKSAVAWMEITTTLNLPEPLVRAKWKNMRDLFKRELKKKNVNSLKDYRGKWRHFKVMWFLHKPVENSNEPEIFTEMIKQEDTDRLKIDYRTSSGVYGSAETDVASDREETVPLECKIFPEEEFQDKEEVLPVKKRRECEQDYDMMFLKSLAPYFRNLDPLKKLKIRSKIQDIILTEISY